MISFTSSLVDLHRHHSARSGIVKKTTRYTIKYSVIASIVSIQELTFMERQVMVAVRYIFEVWITVAALYMVPTLSLSLLTGWLEKRLRASD